MAKGLSDDEKKELARLFKENEKKKQAQEHKNDIYQNLEGRNFEGNHVHVKLKETRFKILKSFNFSSEDLDILNIFNTLDFPEKEYYSVFYTLTSFDYKSFVEEEIGHDFAIQGKFLYVFGANLQVDIEEDSKKTIFYKLSRKIYDLMQQNLSNVNYAHKETLNHYLAVIGYLGLAAPYEKMLIDDNFTLGFNPNKTGNKFCFLIPPYKMENSLFKEIYDFYYQNFTKVLLKDNPLLKKMVNYEKMAEKAHKGDKESGIKKIQDFIGDYQDILSSKLHNLKERGGHK